MYSSCICVEGLSRTTKKKIYCLWAWTGGLTCTKECKSPADNVPLHSAFLSVSLLAALKSYFNTCIPSCSFMLRIANFYIITISKDVPFPRSPRLQMFDHGACNCESLVGPCCVLQIHTQVHWFCASCFWLSRSTVLELKWTQIEVNYT